MTRAWRPRSELGSKLPWKGDQRASSGAHRCPRRGAARDPTARADAHSIPARPAPPSGQGVPPPQLGPTGQDGATRLGWQQGTAVPPPRQPAKRRGQPGILKQPPLRFRTVPRGLVLVWCQAARARAPPRGASRRARARAGLPYVGRARAKCLGEGALASIPVPSKPRRNLGASYHRPRSLCFAVSLFL
jgi:hypothetical protein